MLEKERERERDARFSAGYLTQEEGNRIERGRVEIGWNSKREQTEFAKAMMYKK